jgi:transposase, IS30 family
LTIGVLFMAGYGRPRLPRQVEREFWRLIAAGLPTVVAAVRAGVSETVGSRWFRDGGGMATVDLAEPCGRYLSFAEREEIAVLRDRVSVREIARQLGRPPSTVSRELRRNAPSGKVHLYRANVAQSTADRRARRPKVGKLSTHPPLREYVQDKLAGDEHWSPEQIARRLPVDFPDDEQMRICHETIYQALYVQGRGELRRELTRCLRTGRALRRPRRRVDERRERIKDKVLISERPAEVTDRAVPGHWEGDLIIGKNSDSAIGTLVERTTRFTMLLHLPTDRSALAVREAIATTITTLPAGLRRSLTWDQGIELAEHRRLSFDTDLDIYFCDPHSPWQRGTNENTNGLLRQYFPKGTDLSAHGPEELIRVAAGLNGRPRKTLDWKTPAEALAELLSAA